MISGDIRPELVEKSINSIIFQHESLRAVFSELTPTQKIKLETYFDLQYIDLSHEDDIFIESTVASQVTVMMKPFDLSSPPLIRANLYKIDELRFLLIFCFPHVVLDGSALYLFEQAFMEAYEDLTQGRVSTEKSSSCLQISDYVAWERERASVLFKKQKNFWETRLDGYEQARFPDKFVARGTDCYFDRSIEIPEKFLKGMEAICSQHKVTLQMCMISVIALVMRDVTGSRKFVINSVFENRVEDKLDTVFAPLLYVMPVPVQVNDESTFDTVLNHVKGHMLNAFENIDIPFSIPQGMIAKKRWKRSAKLWAVLLIFFSTMLAKLIPKAKLYPSFFSDYCLMVNPPNISTAKEKKGKFGFRKKAKMTPDPSINVNMLQSFYKNPISHSGSSIMVEPLNDPRKFLPDESLDSQWEDGVVNFYIMADSQKGTFIRITCSCLNDAGVSQLEKAIKSVVHDIQITVNSRPTV